MTQQKIVQEIFLSSIHDGIRLTAKIIILLEDQRMDKNKRIKPLSYHIRMVGHAYITLPIIFRSFNSRVNLLKSTNISKVMNKNEL